MLGMGMGSVFRCEFSVEIGMRMRLELVCGRGDVLGCESGLGLGFGLGLGLGLGFGLVFVFVLGLAIGLGLGLGLGLGAWGLGLGAWGLGISDESKSKPPMRLCSGAYAVDSQRARLHRGCH